MFRSRGLLVLSLLLTPAWLQAEESPALAVSLGVFNVGKSETLLEGGMEYRRPIGVDKLTLALGLHANEESSVWGFCGLRRDFSLGGSWLVTPAFAVALYDEGTGKDLGGTVEFRSSIELGYEWSNRSRLALAFYHLSNAGIYDRNPGSNSLVLTYSFALD